MALDEKAQRKVREYEAELRGKRVRTTAGYASVAVATLFLVMILSGDRFQHILSFFGLSGWYNEERGVYADCGKPENKDVAYCQTRSRSADKDWKSLRGGSKSAVFSLTGR